jgi:putative flippase GtrA
MICREYFWFCINGGILGIVSLGLESLIYRAMGVNTCLPYAMASALTYAALVLINFVIQRRWIFKKNGLFFRFVLANLSIMLLVSRFAPLCRMLIGSLEGAK